MLPVGDRRHSNVSSGYRSLRNLLLNKTIDSLLAASAGAVRILQTSLHDGAFLKRPLDSGINRDVFDLVTLGLAQVTDREHVGEGQVKTILDALDLDYSLCGIISVDHMLLCIRE